MRTPFRPSALPHTAKLLMLVGLLALPSALLTAFRSGHPIAPMAGATFRIDNATGCPYAAIIKHSNNCPATTLPSTTSLSIPAFGSASVTVTGSYINSIELWSGSTWAAWSCTGSGWGVLDQTQCPHPISAPIYHSNVQGDGGLNNKIEWWIW
ncbi:MAG: hypothetical protein IPM68_13130 [Flavobacteriales bacterium]|nr:hypothetical protein [Flavobacteriales bacterium]